MDAPDTLFNDLLDRLVLIDLSVTGITQSLPVFYENPEGPPYPKTMHRIAGWTPPERAGLPMYFLNVRVEKLLIGGPIMTGYARENETKTNVVLLRILAKYLEVPLLNHPTTGAPFDFKVAQQGPPPWDGPNGVQRLSFDPERPNVQYFGAIMTHTFVIRIQQGRKA